MLLINIPNKQPSFEQLLVSFARKLKVEKNAID